MYCKNCGNKVFLGAKFCRYCGFNLPYKVHVEYKKNKGRFGKYLLVIVPVALFFLVILFPSYSKRYSLETTYKKIIQLESENRWQDEYQYLLPAEKDLITYDVFSRGRRTVYSVNADIHDITIDGDEGIVNRTMTVCLTAACEGIDKVVDTNKKKYQYVNGNWYFSFINTAYCNQKVPYKIPPEFDRAVSLIIERSEQRKTNFSINNALAIKSLRNCLDIQYAATDSQLSGAEGFFAFNRESSTERLQIFVSPKYQASDDLLTAILLSHEITHAIYHANGFDKTISCLDNEKFAFVAEYFFVDNLNNEEKSSLTARVNSENSEEVNNLNQTFLAIDNSEGSDIYSKALNMVTNTPFYQKQCSVN